VLAELALGGIRFATLFVSRGSVLTCCFVLKQIEQVRVPELYVVISLIVLLHLLFYL